MEKFIHIVAARVIEVAVTQLPAHQQSEYLEEWLADLAEHNGIAAKLWHACGCAWCVLKTVTNMGGLPEPAANAIGFPGVPLFVTNEFTALRIAAYWAMNRGFAEHNPTFKQTASIALTFVQRTHHVADHEENTRFLQYLHAVPGHAESEMVIYLDGNRFQPNRLADELSWRFRKHNLELWRKRQD